MPMEAIFWARCWATDCRVGSYIKAGTPCRARCAFNMLNALPPPDVVAGLYDVGAYDVWVTGVEEYCDVAS